MAHVNARDWLRNTAGRVWVEALDGPRPDAEPTLDQLIDESAAAIGGETSPSSPSPSAALSATPAPSPRARIVGAALALGAVAVLVLAILTSHAAPAAAPDTRHPTSNIQPPTPARPSPAQAPRMIVAYWAPGGAAVPEPVAEREAYHFTGRMGADWAQTQLPGGGLVWVRRSDLHIDQADLAALAAAPDLTPPTPAPPPVYIPPPVVEQPAQEEAPEPVPTALVVPAMRFPEEAPPALPTPRRVGEKPSSKAPPPGTRAYGLASPLQPPAAMDQPLFGSEPTEAPAPAGGQP